MYIFIYYVMKSKNCNGYLGLLVILVNLHESIAKKMPNPIAPVPLHTHDFHEDLDVHFWSALPPPPSKKNNHLPIAILSSFRFFPVCLGGDKCKQHLYICLNAQHSKLVKKISFDLHSHDTGEVVSNDGFKAPQIECMDRPGIL